jgi:hypothetical protein
MPECSDNVEGMQELEKLLPFCRVTLYNHANARIDAWAAKSVSSAARQLGKEPGRDPENIRRQIQVEGTVRNSQLSKVAGTDKHAPKTVSNEPGQSSAGTKQALTQTDAVRHEV